MTKKLNYLRQRTYFKELTWPLFSEENSLKNICSTFSLEMSALFVSGHNTHKKCDLK